MGDCSCGDQVTPTFILPRQGGGNSLVSPVCSPPLAGWDKGEGDKDPSVRTTLNPLAITNFGADTAQRYGKGRLGQDPKLT